MTPESQRIAIAEVCGWKVIGIKMRIFGNPDDELCKSTSACSDLYGSKNDEIDWIPDYLNDLNAMHEAEMVLDKEKCERYLTFLQGGTPRYKLAWSVVCASAAQRAEQFIRTLNLWVEEPVSEATVEGLR